MKTRMAVYNPEIIQNPTYQAYVNTKTLGENINAPKFYNKTEPINRSNRFTYYDSTVTNSRLHPRDVKTAMKVYDPYAYPPATSTILRGIEKRANAIKDKLLPVFQ